MVTEELGTLNQDLIVFFFEIFYEILSEEGIMDLFLLLLDIKGHCNSFCSCVDFLNVSNNTKLIWIKTDSLLTFLELTFWMIRGADWKCIKGMSGVSLLHNQRKGQYIWFLFVDLVIGARIVVKFNTFSPIARH